MTNSRTKGHTFEREIARHLQNELGNIIDADIKRILDQSREAELGDIEVGDFVVECKRYAYQASPSEAWWEQVWTAATKSGKHPLLVYKFDRQPIRCVVPFYLLNRDYPMQPGYRMEMTFENMTMIMREYINGSDPFVFSPS